MISRKHSLLCSLTLSAVVVANVVDMVGDVTGNGCGFPILSVYIKHKTWVKLV